MIPSKLIPDSLNC